MEGSNEFVVEWLGMGNGGGSQAAINQHCLPLIENVLVPELLLRTETCKRKIAV